MSDDSQLNPQVVSTLNQLQHSTLSGQVAKLAGAGKAYQSVSQSSAIAIQDATDNMRNINTMATTAMGVALAQMLATGNVETYNSVINAANQMMKSGTENFTKVGASAGTVMDSFPSGE